MKLSVEFPSVSYREGPAAVAALARAIERIGYDHIDIFDHVVMGVPIEGRERGPYNAQMPILEALMTLAYIAAATTRVTLGTEVLVLPQRQPALVAKQVGTLDTLSAGRVRLGVGVGWQESEYEALGEEFHDRGARMDERSGSCAPTGPTPRSACRARTIRRCRWRWSRSRRRAAGCRSGSAASRKPPFAAWGGSATAGSRAG